MKRLAALLLALVAVPAGAQESGWHYSPYPGAGDRAALGCSYGSTPQVHACVAVRCEDDFTIGLYLDTTRLGGDAGRWSLTIDETAYPVTAVTVDSPYGARIEGDVAPIIDAIKNGDSFFIDALAGEPPPNNGIGLAGSLNAINRALYFCAPRVVPNTAEEVGDDQ